MSQAKKPKADNTQARDDLVSAFSHPIGDLGFDLEEVDIVVIGNQKVLRVAVDQDGGVTLDDIADVTKVVSGVLDTLAENDPMGSSAYTLEVSSRGVSSPLTLARHWRRNLGRLVKVTTTEAENFTGRIIAAGDDSAEVDVSGHCRKVDLSTVRRAKIQVEFKKADTEEVR